MGFFRRLLKPNETGQVQAPSIGLGSGRRLRSNLAVADCLANLEAILLSYRPLDSVAGPSPSVYRTPYVIPGWRWDGPQEQAPQTVISFFDGNTEFVLAAFWPQPDGTECGLFPLGSGDQRLSAIPIIGHWKQRDSSLTSIGIVPGGQITLTPPRVSDEFVEEILRTAGYPSTPHNFGLMGAMINQMFLQKAHQLISGSDPRASEQFVRNHEYSGGSVAEYCQGVLDDLAAWNPAVLPYIQEIPMRIRAVPLEIAGAPVESVWNQLER